MIVAKFGGSLLSGADGLDRVRREILGLKPPLLVVVSAFGGVTNLLEQLASTALVATNRSRSLLERVVALHREVAAELLTPDACMAWEEAVAPILGRLDEVVRGLGIVRELSGRTLDLVVSVGERLSSALVHASLRRDRPGVAHLSALDLIITDNTHRYARPDPDLTRERVEGRLRPLILESGLVVTEGYIARGTSGETTTMGRESSDYSATMLAEILDASEIHIYTGVPGIMTADPAVVPDALVIERMSFSAAHVLAELGAKILHPRTVTPAERGEIPLVISSLDNRGTIIGGVGGSLPSIALMSDAERISLDLETAGARVESFVRGLSAIVPIVWSERFRRRLQIVTAGRVDLDDLPLSLLDDPPLSVECRSVAVVSVIRESVTGADDLAEALRALEGIPLLGLQSGIDPRSVSFVVERMDAVDAVRALHERLIGIRRGS